MVNFFNFLENVLQLFDLFSWSASRKLGGWASRGLPFAYTYVVGRNIPLEQFTPKPNLFQPGVPSPVAHNVLQWLLLLLFEVVVVVVVLVVVLVVVVLVVVLLVVVVVAAAAAAAVV